MSDLYNTPTPLDNLIGSSLIGSRSELMAERSLLNTPNAGALNEGKTKGKSFQDTLSEYASGNSSTKSSSQNSAAMAPGCHPLIAMNCEADKALQNSQDQTQKDIESSVSNILNADKPGYKKVLPYKDENGNYIIDDSPGKLQRTNWQLDLGVDGRGKGFKLANGEYTRDGRFKYDEKGRPVTVEKGIPLEICYEEGAPMDWSLKRLKIDFDGTVIDEQTSQKLGKIIADTAPQGKVMQYYIERSNVNLPLEFIGLTQKFRLVDLTNGLFSAGNKLDSEAVNILRGL